MKNNMYKNKNPTTNNKKSRRNTRKHLNNINAITFPLQRNWILRTARVSAYLDWTENGSAHINIAWINFIVFLGFLFVTYTVITKRNKKMKKKIFKHKQTRTHIHNQSTLTICCCTYVCRYVRSATCVYNIEAMSPVCPLLCALLCCRCQRIRTEMHLKYHNIKWIYIQHRGAW